MTPRKRVSHASLASHQGHARGVERVPKALQSRNFASPLRAILRAGGECKDLFLHVCLLHQATANKCTARARSSCLMCLLVVIQIVMSTAAEGIAANPAEVPAQPPAAAEPVASAAPVAASASEPEPSRGPSGKNSAESHRPVFKGSI